MNESVANGAARRRLERRTKIRYLAAHVLRGAARLQRLRVTPRQERYFLAAVVRVKDEGRFLPELIAHHHLIGVEHFYIYDNNSSDDPASVLAPLIAAGLVTVIPWKPVPASPSCYVHFLERHAGECRWVAFIDADEFITEATPGLLLETLRSRPNVPALAINWRYFGSAGHDAMPGGLVLENFTMGNAVADGHIKVIAQPSHIRNYYNSHNFVYGVGEFATTAAGAVVLGSRSVPVDLSLLSINHYVYRSRQNYLQKIGLGFVDAKGAEDQARRLDRVETEFVKHNDREFLHARDLYADRVRAFLIAKGYGAPYV